MEVTFTRIVHVEFAGITALLNATEVPPLTAVNKAEAPQFDNVEETGLARTTLDGNWSVMDAWVSTVSRSLFLILIVNWLVCPTNMVLGEKLLFIVGA